MSARTTPLLVLTLGAIAIGFSPIFMRLSELGPIATAFYRITLALPIFVLWAWLGNGRQQRATLAYPRLLLLLCGFLFAGDLAFWHWAVNRTTVANATLLSNLAPFVVTPGAWLLFRERVSILFLIGLMVAIAGAVLLVSQSFAVQPENLTGDLFGLITALFYGAYLLTLSQLRRYYSVAVIMAVSGITTAACLLLLALTYETHIFPLTLQGLGYLLLLSWISHAGGQGLITWSVAHLPISLSSVVLLMQPVVAALLAWMLFNEQLSTSQMAGAVLVLAGIYISKRANH